MPPFPHPIPCTDRHREIEHWPARPPQRREAAWLGAARAPRGGHVVWIRRNEGKRRYCPTTACKHLDRSGRERIDDRVHVLGLDRGVMVDATIFPGAASQPAGVIRHHRAIWKVGGERAEPAGIHGLADHEERWTSVGGRQWPLYVEDDVGFIGPKGTGLHSRSSFSCEQSLELIELL